MYFHSLDKDGRAAVLKRLSGDKPCVMDGNGNVQRPNDLYSPELSQYIVSDPESKLPNLAVLADGEVLELGFRKNLATADCIEFLRSNPDYNQRGRVLMWLARDKPNCEGRPDLERLIDEYRNDDRSTWKNGQGEFARIDMLVAIKNAKASRAREFNNDPHVLSLKDVGVRRKDEGWKDVEEGLLRLKIPLIDDDDLMRTPVPANDGECIEVDKQIKNDLAVRLFVFLASRNEDGWQEEFTERSKLLESIKFVPCKSISICYKDILRSEREKFLQEDGAIYFVGDWQGKHIFQRMIESIRTSLDLKQFQIDDLGDAFDTDGDDERLASRIVDEHKELLKNGNFTSILEHKYSSLWQKVQNLMHKGDAVQERAEISNVEKGPAEAKCEAGADNGKDDAEEKPPEKHFTEAEEMQMQRVFGNDLTIDQMNDENRLVCIRLFNSLKAKGFEPRMVEIDFVKDMYENQQTFRSSTFRSSTIETKDGRQIHIVSARKGVAYLPPKWWTRIADPDNSAYVVCAVMSHHDDGFKYLKNREDLLAAIGENLVVIRVHGNSSEDRLSRSLNLFKFNPELSDCSTYALLSMRRNNPIAAAFLPTSDEMSISESKTHDDL